MSTTYLDGDGDATGIAVVGGSCRTGAAQALVRSWSAALRTRRAMVARPPRPCPDSPYAVVELPVPRDGSAPPAHPGAATPCPAPALAGAAVRRYLDEGDAVLLVGPGRSRPWAPDGRVLELARVEDVERLVLPVGVRPAFVVRPCAVVDDVTPLLTALRARFPELRGQHPDQWCHRASATRWAHRAVAAASDLTLLLGEARVDAATLPTGARVRRVRGLGDLLPAELAAAATVGLIPAAPAVGTANGDDMDTALLDAVLQVLTGLGPLGIVEHRVWTEVVPLPTAPSAPVCADRAPRHRD
ncbi:hypothetical protein [Kitasatospora phosalacinea]|uniref:hypothetical protein n=1 Tax=Kitasatospora phosalacinea TaxID=2065 RepID=UPI002552DCFC|nr:hypothetical protein [Kitasatospora phosalacinea]